MASQSPNRLRRTSASTHRTKYSIDWDALKGPGSDASSLPDNGQRERLDVIHSDEIDGPTDFTQNLEYWMRAPLALRGTSQQVNVTEPGALADDEIAEDIGEYIDEDEHDEEEGSVLQTPQRNHLDVGGINHAKARTRSPRSPQSRSRRSSASSIEQDEKVRSYLETLPDAEVPSIIVDSPRSAVASHKAKSIRSLQPTVEDAETTPRKTSHGSIAPPVLETPEHEKTLRGRTHQIAELQEQLLRQASALSDAQARHREEMEHLRKAMEQEKKEAMVAAVADAQASHREERQRAQMLADKENADRANASAPADAQHRLMKQDLARYEEELEKTRFELADTKDRHDAVTRRLAESDKILEQAEQQKEEAKNSAETLEHQARDLQQRLSARDEEFKRMRSQLEVAEDRGDSLFEAEEQARIAREELDRAQAELDVLRNEKSSGYNTVVQHDESSETEARFKDLRNALSELQNELVTKDSKHKEEMKSLRIRAEDGIKKVGDMFETEKAEKLRVKRELKSLREELSRKTGALDAIQHQAKMNSDAQASREQQGFAALKLAIDTQTATLDTVRQELETTKAQLASTLSDLNNMRDELQATSAQTSSSASDIADLHSELEATKAQLATSQEDYDAVNRMFEQRIQQLIREREQRWRQKLESVLKERSQMGRALMHEWGKEEFGKNEPQIFRYQYAQR